MEHPFQRVGGAVTVTDFGRLRNRQEAALLYLISMVTLLIVEAVVGGALSLFAGTSALTSLFVANLLAVVVCFWFGFRILQAKNHLDNGGYWMLVLLAGLLALPTGPMLGMIPIAFLTTRKRPGQFDDGAWQRDTDVPLDNL